jgi:hypothetical protein
MFVTLKVFMLIDPLMTDEGTVGAPTCFIGLHSLRCDNLDTQTNEAGASTHDVELILLCLICLSPCVWYNSLM